MAKRIKRTFNSEFKSQAVDLVRQSGKGVSQVARDLDLGDSVLRSWMDRANGKSAALDVTTTEREELVRLRKEVVTLRMERDFLKKAAAFFAKESK